MQQPSYSQKVVSGIIKYLSETRKSSLLPEVVSQLESLLSGSKKAKQVVVTSCVPFSDQQKRQVYQILVKFDRQDLPLFNKIDKSLLGGFTVRVGDWFLDASLRRQLHLMSNSLLA